MRIAIITPSSPCDPESFAKGLEILSSWGHEIIFSPNHRRPPARYCAGTPQERLSELNWALKSDADLIMAARGGYGVHQILPLIDQDLVKKAAKPLLGFSDITALHQIWLKAGIPTYHGSNVTGLTKIDSLSLQATKNFLAGMPEPFASEGSDRREAFDVEQGEYLIGGNVAMLASLCGTPYLFKPEAPAALILEDVGEAPYRLDRLLQQLFLAGYFQNVSRVFLGEFKNCDPTPDKDYTALQVVEEFFAQLAIPVISDFPVGHGQINVPVLFGLI